MLHVHFSMTLHLLRVLQIPLTIFGTWYSRHRLQYVRRRLNNGGFDKGTILIPVCCPCFTNHSPFAIKYSKLLPRWRTRQASTMVAANQGKKTGGFRSLFKRKKEVIPEKVVGTKNPSSTVDAPSKGANASLPSPPPKPEPNAELKPESKPETKPEPVVESRPPIPEVAVVKGTSKPEKASGFSRTHYFKEMSNWAFDVVDLDGSGFVDEKVSFPTTCSYNDITVQFSASKESRLIH